MHWRYFVVVASFGILAFLAACSSGSSGSPTPAPRAVPLPPRTHQAPAATQALNPPTTPPTSVSVATSYVVAYRNGAFEPRRLDVPAGAAVRFVNESPLPFWPASNIHPTHIIYPEFDAKAPIPPGQSWTFTFAKAGFWRYHNHLVPEQSGLVVALAPAKSGTPEPAPATPTPAPIPTFKTAPRLTTQEAARIFDFNDHALLKQFIKDYGPAAAVQALAQHAPNIGADCHQGAHHIGRTAYELFGAAAYGLATHDCQSSLYHGTTEAFFRERGTTDLTRDVQSLCGSEPSIFYQHQCIHGIGHGLMAWTSYEIHDALALCDTLAEPFSRDSCQSGVFMENVVGGLSGLMGHKTAYLSNDPHYPCNALGDRYVFQCYFFQSSRMLDLFNGDFRKVAEACGQAPANAHLTCFQSMGRDVDARTKGHPEQAIAICHYAALAQDQVDCLIGAVQLAFWEPKDADAGLKYCQVLSDQAEKRVCYSELVTRAHQIILDRPALERFCARVDDRYRTGCP